MSLTKDCVVLIFGDKTLALFDVWSIEHLVAGMSIGSISFVLNRRYRVATQLGELIEGESLLFKLNKYYVDILFLLLFAFVWEAIEHYLETGAVNPAVTFWFQGVEYHLNRLLTDPLLVLVGGLLSMKYRRIVLPARIFSLVWLVFHIFIFPHSMYLHHVFSL